MIITSALTGKPIEINADEVCEISVSRISTGLGFIPLMSGKRFLTKECIAEVATAYVDALRK